MDYGRFLASAVAFALIQTVYAAPISMEVKDIFDTIVCNFACFIEYVILAISAAVIVLSGFRYMTSDDPKIRHEMRGYIIYSFIGLFVVVIGLPAMSIYIESAQQSMSTKILAPFNCECTPHHQFKEFFENISCRTICLIEYITAFIASLIMVVAGIRYMTSNDPRARKSLRSWMINALIGLLFIALAVPVLNYLTDGAISPLNCDCMNLGSSMQGFIKGGEGEQKLKIMSVPSEGDVCNKCCIKGSSGCYFKIPADRSSAGKEGVVDKSQVVECKAEESADGKTMKYTVGLSESGFESSLTINEDISKTGQTSAFCLCPDETPAGKCSTVNKKVRCSIVSGVYQLEGDGTCGS